MPYRADIRGAPPGTLERVIELGALDVDVSGGGAIAALMPDAVTPQQLARAIQLDSIDVSPARGRDADSVWVLDPPPIRVGHPPRVITLADAAAFGTGLHPTTALCLEALEAIVEEAVPDAVLDVGTGSGVLAIAALLLGVPRALGIDFDRDALRVAADNGRVNGVSDRLQLTERSLDGLTGAWPLILANIVAAELIEMAPAIVRHLGRRGQLVLSGIASSLEEDVASVYGRAGMRHVRTLSRAGWIAIVMQASW